MALSFQPETLRAGLADFPVSVSRAPDLNAYRHYYRIDFEQQIPALKVDLGKIKVNDFEIVLHHYLPSQAKGTVFIVHGYYDHVGVYRHLIQFLIRHGYAVVVFDLPGHGLSSGDRASIESFDQYQQVWKRVIEASKGLPEPWHAVAQSTGAAIVSEFILTATQQGLLNPFQRAVFYAPLVRPVNWVWKSHLHSMVHPFVSSMARTFSDSSNDKGFLAFRLQDPLQSRNLSLCWVNALKRWIPHFEDMESIEFPLLIIQGKADETVDWKYNIPVLQRLFKDVNVIYMDEVKHHVANEIPRFRKNAFDQTLNYISNHSLAC